MGHDSSPFPRSSVFYTCLFIVLNHQLHEPEHMCRRRLCWDPCCCLVYIYMYICWIFSFPLPTAVTSAVSCSAAEVWTDRMFISADWLHLGPVFPAHRLSDPQFTLGSKMHLERSDHKWLTYSTPYSQTVKMPELHLAFHQTRLGESSWTVSSFL